MLDFLGSILSSEIILAVLCLGSVELTGWGRENIMLLHEAIIQALGSFPQLSLRFGSFSSNKES